MFREINPDISLVFKKLLQTTRLYTSEQHSFSTHRPTDSWVRNKTSTPRQKQKAPIMSKISAVIHPFKAYWLRDAPTDLKVNNLRSAHAVFMCFVFIWEQRAVCATYITNGLVFITKMKSVYCAVRTGSLNKAVCVSSLKG